MSEHRSYNISIEKPIYITNKNMFSPKKQQNKLKRKNKTNENERDTPKKKRKLYSSNSDIYSDKSETPRNSFNSASEYIRFKHKTSTTLNLDNKKKPYNNVPSNRIGNNSLKIDLESSPGHKNDQDSKLSFSKTYSPLKNVSKDDILEKLHFKILSKIYTNKTEGKQTSQNIRTEKNIQTNINLKSSPIKNLSAKNKLDTKVFISEDSSKCEPMDKNVGEPKNCDILSKNTKSNVKEKFSKKDVKSYKSLLTENNIETKINLQSVSNEKNLCNPKYTKSETKQNNVEDNTFNLLQRRKQLLPSEQSSIQPKTSKSSSTKSSKIEKDSKLLSIDDKFNFSSVKEIKKLNTTPVKAPKLLLSATSTKLNTKFLLSDPKCVSNDKNLYDPKYSDILSKIYTKSVTKQNNEEENTLFTLLQRRKQLLPSEQDSQSKKSKSSSTKSSKIEKDSKSLDSIDDKFNRKQLLPSEQDSQPKTSKSSSTKSSKIEKDSKLLSFDDKFNFSSPSSSQASKLLFSPSKSSTKKSNSKKLPSVRNLNFSPAEVSVKESKKYKHDIKLLKTVGNTPKCISNDQNAFLASLSDSVSSSDSHPDALIYKENFKETRQELTERLFNLFNTEVFANKIPSNTTVEWSNRMVSSAGFTHNKRAVKLKSGEQIYSSRIKLSTKVVDRPSRLRDVLIHEMCHAITWIVHNVKDGHGTFWKTWAQKAMTTFPSLPVIVRCHSYDVPMKYTYRCKQCGYSFGRHSKSVNIEQKCCGYCKGRFEIILNK
ncbi:inner centromere protein A-like, partial [Chrysoperla carnea]|uniref:inner centromere protein A-like n=1 Tax=Chrysoperla carnea TaxID=189513 RepID=UPI001D068602